MLDKKKAMAWLLEEDEDCVFYSFELAWESMIKEREGVDYVLGVDNDNNMIVLGKYVDGKDKIIKIDIVDFVTNLQECGIKSTAYIYYEVLKNVELQKAMLINSILALK